MRPVPSPSLRASLAAVVLVAYAAASAAVVAGRTVRAGGRWTDEQRATLRSLSLASLGPLPADPSNRYGDDTLAARLGRRLFFDPRLSANGKVSCATCHVPALGFQDGRPLSAGVGTTARRAMPIAGTAYSPWQFWDGRADSQWEQALGPLESAVEHGGDRTRYAHLLAGDAVLRAEYERVFGRLPGLDGLPAQAGPVEDPARAAAWRAIPAGRRDEITRVYANIGKSIAAYERRITYAPTRFDRYVDAELAGRAHRPDDALSPDEEAGLRVFLGKGNCVNCHDGARLTDDHFHNVATPAVPGLPADSGRSVGVRRALAAEFACTGRYSDAKPGDCAELEFAVTDGDDLVGAYKTPSLRGVAERAPYMHAGQLATLGEVIAHYDRPPRPAIGRSELKPLHLTARERAQLEAFLRTLSAPAAAPPGWLEPPAR